MRRDVLVAALAVLALLAVSLLGKRESGAPAATHASGDYAFGGYRAWYELLAREGVRVDRFRRHHDALSGAGIDTLILAFPDAGGSFWNTAERDALRAWVRGGGRLVDVGLTPPAGRDDAKGERVLLNETRGDRGPLHGTWSRLVPDVPDRGTARLRPIGRARVEVLLADRAGDLAVRYAYGRGEVFGVANAALFENRSLGRGDDARLAFLLARPRHGVVAFDDAIRGDLLEKAWYRALTAPQLVALALAALAGLLWLAYGIVPLGPGVRLRTPREPTSAEFVDAVAALYRRAGAREHARDALLREARRLLERAPRTPENLALGARVAAAAAQPPASDAALVAIATLARTVRQVEGRMIVQRAPRHRERRRTPVRAGRGGT